MATAQLPILTLEGVGIINITEVSTFTIGGLEADVFMDTQGNVFETVTQIPSVFECTAIYDDTLDIDTLMQIRRSLATIEYQTIGKTWQIPNASVTMQSGSTVGSDTGQFTLTIKGKKALLV